MAAKISERPRPDSESLVTWWNPLNWPAGIWVLLIAMGLMTIPFIIRTIMLAGIPDMPEPFDEAAFSAWDVPAAEDAFTEYREATALNQQILIDLKTQGKTDIREKDNPMVVLKQGWPEATESTKQWLKVHHESMSVWRRGTQKERGLNLSPTKLSYKTRLNIIQEQLPFARLAILEESRLIDSGDIDEARQWARAAFRCGGHSSYRGCNIQGQCSVIIHAVASAGIAHWAEQPNVTSAQLQQALADAQSDDKLYESLSNILKAEYLGTRNSLRSPDWVAAFSPLNSGVAPSDAASKGMRLFYWVIGEPETSLRVSRQILANQLPEIDKPVNERRKIVGLGVKILFDPDPSITHAPEQMDPAAIDRAHSRSSLIRLLAPSIAHLDSAFLDRRARQATLEALLAAQAYRRDHGEFPDSLAQLVPNYLAVVPVDPGDPAGRPLHYRRDEPTKAIIWSVGQDRTDEGGMIDSSNGRAPDVGFLLK